MPTTFRNGHECIVHLLVLYNRRGRSPQQRPKSDIGVLAEDGCD
jgi:hypothetical protein